MASEFATSLVSLLDDTALFTRTQWAEILRVSEADIQTWTMDENLPNSVVLRSLLDCVRFHHPIPHELLQKFYEMATKPASEVTLLWQSLKCATFAEYVMQPRFEGIQRRMCSMDISKQELILDATIDAIEKR